jgi:hypothetical protein
MTVFEILDIKYRAEMKEMKMDNWKRIISLKQHPAKTIYMGLEITETDIRKNGGWNSEFFREIDRMHKDKLLASNKHRQAHGQVTKYWLTAKGWSYINKDHAVC